MDQKTGWRPVDGVTLTPDDNLPVCQPIYQSVKFTLPNMRELRRLFRGERDGYFYSRYRNPTVRQLETTLATWQGVADGVAVASGVSAIASTLLTFADTSREIVYFLESYRPTRLLLEKVLARMGVPSRKLSIHDEVGIRQAFAEPVSMVIFESPTNPQLKAAPIDLITGLARQQGSLVVMDNTLAGFHNHHRDDIDLYLHSLTKYANGHSDALGGAVLGRHELIRQIHETVVLLGPSMDPQAAYLTLRGLQTYWLRYERSCETAGRLARWLEQQPEVERVFYPGLTSHPDHEVFKAQQRDFGGVIMVNLRNKQCNLDDFIDGTQHFKLLASLGSVESLIAPVEFFFGGGLSADEKKQACIDATSFRLAIGLEPFEHLRDDLAAAFARFA
jgi:cystathionine beta-lyase/cystathionine gamma-synthase